MVASLKQPTYRLLLQLKVKYPAYAAGTAYSRYDIEDGGKVYQAYLDIVVGAGAPTHSTGDVSGWRFLNNAAVEQKGLASFAQEDFDVDANGHVTIAASAIDNTQLENTRIILTDRNTTQEFILDDELTATNAPNGFNYLNHVYINDTSGALLFTANNVDNSGSGGVDINVDTNISGARIVLDRPGTSPLQTIERTAGSLFIHHNVSSATQIELLILLAIMLVLATPISISLLTTALSLPLPTLHKVQVEDFYFQENHLGTSNGTLVLDPEDDDGITGTVQIRGNLQVDGTTTTVNSTTITVDDPIIVLGGDTAPTTDDGKDRGVEFSYYDSQARVGFYGWDESVTRLDGGTGGFSFLYNATNTGEVFSGTDAYLKAGALSLTTNTGSTSSTTGTLVVTGGVGISENINIAGTSTFNDDVLVNKNFILRDDGSIGGANGYDFKIQNQYGHDKFTVDSVLGATTIGWSLDVGHDTSIEGNLLVFGANHAFRVRDGNSINRFTVDSDNGNTDIDGTLNTDGAVTFNSTLDVDDATTLNNTLDVDLGATFHDSILMDTTGKTFTITNGSVNKFQVSSTNGNTDIEGP